MRFQAFLNRLDKLYQTIRSKRLLHALLRHRVLADAEHRQVLAAKIMANADSVFLGTLMSVFMRSCLRHAKVLYKSLVLERLTVER